MSGIPEEIPEFGDIHLKPTQNPSYVPGAGFGTEEYFVWSRCDGAASLRDIILSNGFPTPKSVDILVKLRRFGALLVPGESKAPSFPATTTVTASSAAAPTRAIRASIPPLSSEQLPTAPAQVMLDGSEEELAALAMGNILDAPARQRIIELRRKIGNSSFYEMLEIEADSDKRTVKRAYFRLSKEFHPDRYYGKELGPFGPWLADIFKSVNQAFGVLGNNRKRSAYESELRGGTQKQPQTKEEHAEALFHSACDAELQGQSEQALKLFAASIRMDEKPRRLRRAAMCAVSAGKLSEAEEYAKKGVEVGGRDASYLRVLADVYRAGGRLDEALEVLERALKIDTENDVLFGELQSDLAAVKAAVAERLAAQESV